MATIKVRIPVAVDKNGKWAANGWDNNNDWLDMMEGAIEVLEQGEARYWVEAELAIPEGVIAEVQGVVTQA